MKKTRINFSPEELEHISWVLRRAENVLAEEKEMHEDLIRRFWEPYRDILINDERKSLNEK